MLRRILVPLDGSQQSRAALDLAISVASDTHARLVLVSAVDVTRLIAVSANPYALTDPTTVIEGSKDEAKEILEDAAHILASNKLPCETHVLEGSPVSAILDAAREYHADLIVMGTHGRSGLARAFLGSTTEGVLREGRIPVLVTHGQVHGAQRTEQTAERRLVEASQ